MHNSNPVVAVLMSTYNGELFLRQQIDSVLLQRGCDVRLYVRDDGSTDGTLDILDEYSSKGLLGFRTGKNIGPAASFYDLLIKSPKADYYAFCDQDDYWKPDKLDSALKCFAGLSSIDPALYCSNLTLVDENLEYMGDYDHPGIASLGSSLILNKCTGCTMVINHRLKSMISPGIPKNMIMHDEWIYSVALAVGSSVFFEEDSHVLYRQHSANVVGGDNSAYSLFSRRAKNLVKHKRRRSKKAGEILRLYSSYISEDNARTLRLMSDYRLTFSDRIRFAKSGEYKTGVTSIDVSRAVLALLGLI